MATCAVDTLLSSNPCFVMLARNEQLAIITQMLCNLRAKLDGGGETPCDIQELLTQAVCFVDKPEAVLLAMQEALLCDIADLV